MKNMTSMKIRMAWMVALLVVLGLKLAGIM